MVSERYRLKSLIQTEKNFWSKAFGNYEGRKKVSRKVGGWGAR